MVHALHEARRVLKPNGLLIDLRPAPAHRQLGVLRAGQWQPLGGMRERFDEDYAADRAVATVVRQGLFKAEGRVSFEVRRTMDSLAEFQVWLDEFVSLGKLVPHAWLASRVERAVQAGSGRTKIVVSGPLNLRVLRKLGRP